MPHHCVDPLVAAEQIVMALQTRASRTVDPLGSCVVSVTRFEAGSANNVIPRSAWLNGTVRTLQAATRDYVDKRIHEIVASLATAARTTASVNYRRIPAHPKPPSTNDGHCRAGGPECRHGQG